MRDRAIFAANEAQMLEVGAQIYAALKSGVIFLEGDLGAGKTTLSKGVIRAAGHTGTIKSPTYTIVEPYEVADQSVYHFDLYRLSDPEELEYLGIRDYFESQHLSLIEWPKKGLGFLPLADLSIDIAYDPNGRWIRIVGHTEKGIAAAADLNKSVSHQ